MSQAIWYYTQGDAQAGPVSAQELKSLATSGKLLRDDLVWKEGMDDWAPASEVRGLFPESSAEPPEPPPASNAGPPPVSNAGPEGNAPSPRGGSPPDAPPLGIGELPRGSGEPLSIGGSDAPSIAARWPRPFSFQPLKHGAAFGQPALLIGLMAVLLAKGCDAVGNRNIVRLNAQVQLAQQRLNDNKELTPVERQEEQERIEDLQKDAKEARLTNDISGYWREILFVFGSIVLSVGLLATGFTSDGPARWICLLMLAIITFSLYVGGIAWIGSISNAFR